MPLSEAKMKVNPFYVRKIKSFFRYMDVDKSGILTREDYELLADRYVEIANVDSGRVKQARRKLLGLWEKYFEKVSTKTPMTPEVWAQCLGDGGRERVIASAQHFSDLLFDLIDLNLDGIIRFDEFLIMHKLFYRDENTAEVAFKALDVDKKGYLNYDQFTEAVIDYFLPDDEQETPGSLIFGPLID